jgi:hypothetical protein
MRHTTCSLPVYSALFATVFLVGSCAEAPTSASTDKPLSTQAPANGNGTKEVVTFNFDVSDPFTCPGGEQLTLHVGGWAQLRALSNSNRVEVDIFHVIHTWRNSAGATFIDREIGPDRYYIDKNTGHLILASTGKLSFAGIMGQIVTDLTTGEVIFVTGPGFPDHLQLACAALT